MKAIKNKLIISALKWTQIIVFAAVIFISEELSFAAAFAIGGCIPRNTIGGSANSPVMTPSEAIITSIAFFVVLMVELYAMLKLLRLPRNLKASIFKYLFAINVFLWGDVAYLLCSDPDVWPWVYRFKDFFGL